MISSDSLRLLNSPSHSTKLEAFVFFLELFSRKGLITQEAARYAIAKLSVKLGEKTYSINLLWMRISKVSCGSCQPYSSFEPFIFWTYPMSSNLHRKGFFWSDCTMFSSVQGPLLDCIYRYLQALCGQLSGLSASDLSTNVGLSNAPSQDP